MNRQDCVVAIGKASTEFLVRLRGREFSHGHYDTLMLALRAYRDIVRGQDWLEREVVYWLYYLDLGLHAALQFFPRTEAERTLINEAQLECSNLILEILTPEHMTGSIPDELQE